MIDARRDAPLLGAVHEMVEQDAEPAARSGPELAHHRLEVVHSSEMLDDHALDSKVVTPDLLDELGVMEPLDIDPTGPRESRRHGAEIDRARRGSLGAGAVGGLRRPDGHRLAVEQEVAVGGPVCVVTTLRVAQHDLRRRERHQLAPHPRAAVHELEPGPCVDPRVFGGLSLLRVHVDRTAQDAHGRRT